MIIKSNATGANTPLITAAGFGQPARIIIADSDTTFTSTLSNFLMAQPGFNVVAKVESCADALIWCEELSPDILILDWHLMFEGLLPGEMKGVPFVKQVKALKKAPAVIIASRLSLDDHRNMAMQAGADEFMAKSKFPQLIRPLISRLMPQF
jgi:DNA-binding NarL/FixJ family response regulator